MNGYELDHLENRTRFTSTISVPGHGVILCSDKELTVAMVKAVIEQEVPKILARKEYW